MLVIWLGELTGARGLTHLNTVRSKDYWISLLTPHFLPASLLSWTLCTTLHAWPMEQRLLCRRKADREWCIPPVDSISETINELLQPVPLPCSRNNVYHKTSRELGNSHAVVRAVEILSDHLSKRKLRDDNSKLQLVEVLKCKKEDVRTWLMRFQG